MLEVKQPIVLTQHELERTDLQFTESDWTLLQDLVNLLQVFHDSTNLVSGNTYPTINLMLPALTKITTMTDTEVALPFAVTNVQIIKKVCDAMHINANTR